MKGDFSRITHRPGAGYSQVLMQQGRVQLDADWNEQGAILNEALRRMTRDLFGPFAGPAEECGFQVVTSENLGTLDAPVQEQVNAFLKREGATLGDDEMVILPGRYYVAGLCLEARAPVRFRAQAGFPFDGDPKADLTAMPWLAYLDVWEEFVGADQDTALADVGLGGIDTCGRAKVLWAVRILPKPTAQDIANGPARRTTGTARISANPSEDADSLCTIAPDASYRGPENQFYRIEVHGRSDAAGKGATFKWSRDNGSIVFPVASKAGNALRLKRLGRDERTTLKQGDWVELIDDATLVWPGVGALAQVVAVDRDEVSVEIKPAEGVNLSDYGKAEAAALHPLLRRWDQQGDYSRSGGAIPTAAEEIELEDGVKVQFKLDGEYRAGDYWAVPVRVALKDVDAPDGFIAPMGPQHHFAPLAVRAAGAAAVVLDKRCRIARLACI